MYTETKDQDQDLESLIRRLLNSEEKDSLRQDSARKAQMRQATLRKPSVDSQEDSRREDSRREDKKPVNMFGSPHGEEREVVIRYRIGDEQNAVLSVHSDGSHGAAEDSLAVAYSLGQLAKLGITDQKVDTSDISAKAISSHIINAMMDGIADEIRKSLLRIIEKEVAKWE